MSQISIVLEAEQRAQDFDRLAPSGTLDEIGSSEHFVQFYEDDSCLVQSVSDFVAKGFSKGESAIIIATEAHRRSIESRLVAGGTNLTRLILGGKFISLDASETLSKFMVGDLPDAALFHSTLGSLISHLTLRGSGLRAFGEMVALLWAEGNSRGAIALEELWNELAKSQTFALFCAYPLKEFQSESDAQPFQHICRAHSRVIPAESYSRRETTVDERLRTITALQQRAASLEAEIVVRKRCQEDLALREHELRDFLENATEGIHQVDAEGKIIWANRAEFEFLGYTADEYIGHDIADFHADPTVIDDIFCRLKRGEKLHDYEARLKHKDGSIRHVSINSSGHWEKGEFSQTRCFTRDISERKRAADLLEKTVAERTAQLQETVAELEAFSYSISHDMRSPLRAMQAYAASVLEDYRDKPLDEEAADRLERIQRAATRLDLLIRDVLAYSKVAKGELALRPVCLRTLVGDILEQQFGLPELKPCITVDQLHSVLGHEAYITQCITNLIDNALKFVAPGAAPKVRIQSERLGDRVRITVSDSGIGIRPEHCTRVFKMFGRVYSERQYAGTGIGLAIVQKAVSRMGGEVGLESEPGIGTTFWFTLPAGETA
ncbi:MAG TPA: ATP-binding protein [Verrucomicrobiae bacterium]|nr:ATP-binding protein [Verrucomicrobiae bacterium]